MVYARFLSCVTLVTMYVGIDIGGTKTFIARFSPSGELEQKIRFETPSEYPAFLEKLKSELSQLDLNELKRCVVGVPGRIDRHKGIGISFGNLAWQDVAIGSDIESLLGKPVHIENDANLAGLYEANVVRESYKNVFYITISTGIGGSNIRNGVLDSFSIDAEPGHMKFEHDGKLQKWESFASGSAIVRTYGKRASEIEDPAVWQHIVSAWMPGFMAIASLITPEAIIIGGGVGTHFKRFADTLTTELRTQTSPMVAIPTLLPASKPEDCVIYGCYTLASQHENA